MKISIFLIKFQFGCVASKTMKLVKRVPCNNEQPVNITKKGISPFHAEELAVFG